jgi:hypothetical protein
VLTTGAVPNFAQVKIVATTFANKYNVSFDTASSNRHSVCERAD